MQAFREFKRLWDPEGKMNPGKVVEPYRIDQNLRLGTDYAPEQPKTHFSFHEDGGSFAHATLRCVGVGKCRRENGGTMCPSYMVTREEMHATRGRARLLFEMLQGEVITDGWKSEHVKEALDLCLACKGCKGDCPVNVDMATYKAEFLSHYYAGRLRPRSAYAFGLIMYWARLAALRPEVANFLTQTPLLRGVAKAIAGVAPKRRIPAFAPRTFQDWFRKRGARNQGKPVVILWPDTFNNHFHPGTAAAAVEVLEAAGWQVHVPSQFLCCGRPFYDFGMLELAKRHLRQILVALRPQIRAGVPIVGLEPSCISVFRDEMVDLFPHDQDARRLRQQVFLLSEFLEQQVDDYRPPRLQRRALVQGHCHHKAVLRMDAEIAILNKLGLDYDVPDSGCCGMAGAFGFEAGDHYEVAVRAGERVLLPAVRKADADTLIIADGFSCREQIAQGTGRRALHLAQVLRMALREGTREPSSTAPAKRPRGNDHDGRDRAHTRKLATGATVGASLIVATAGLACALNRERLSRL
jgi:Fe-S oxidoreductase